MMKMTLTRTGGFLIVSGGLAGLVGFLFLPFGMDPQVFRMTSGLQLVGRYFAILQDMFVNAPPAPSGLDIRGYQVAASLSYGSAWTIIVVGVLLVVFAAILVVRGRSGMSFPLVCLLLSLVSLVSLFLFFANWGTNGENLFLLMLPRDSFPRSIVGIGWVVSMIGTFLAGTGSIVGLRGRRSKRATLESRWTA